MRFLAFIGALAIVGALAAAGFFFGGFFNISAALEDTAVEKWALVRVRTNAIARHATDTPPANLGDSARVQAGAANFDKLGCPVCHGAPGVKWAKFSEGINPDPPDLKEVAHQLPAAQIFWVIKNGIRMTGMPSFGAIGAPDDDIWSVVAFVKKLPDVTEADYKTWSVAKP